MGFRVRIRRIVADYPVRLAEHQFLVTAIGLVGYRVGTIDSGSRAIYLWGLWEDQAEAVAV